MNEKTPRSYEEQTEERKYALHVPDALPDRGWPTWQGVVEQHPDLCMEEQSWILEGLLAEAHRLKYGGGDENDKPVQSV